MLFQIEAERNAGDKQIFLYDNETNTLSTAEGYVFEFSDNTPNERKDAIVFGKDSPLKKSGHVKLLKIQLGLSCNYSCDYCSQRFVERAPETSKKDIDAFIAKLDNLSFDEEKGLKIEMWGGEPFVYWKTMRPLTAAIKEKFSSWQNPPKFSVITNGSILTQEMCDWLYDEGFSMAISHDGPNQHVRGPDPFEDEDYKKFILKFYRRMRRENRISFNAMLNRHNMSRKDIHEWFIDFTGDFSVPLGEGGMIDAYDNDGLKNALQTKADHFAFRQTAFKDILQNKGDIGFTQVVEKIDTFTRDVLSHRPASTVGQKCGMDRQDTLAVDLRGDVITCQNTSSVETAMNGQPHLSGNITDMENVSITTATHWRNRKHCSECPVVHICKGSCMYLEGQYWETSCAGAYSDAIAIFSLALEKITGGYIPTFIKNEHLPDERRDIWGNILTHVEDKPKAFPIKVVAAEKVLLDGVQVFKKAAQV